MKMYRSVVFFYLLAIAFGDDIPKPKSHRNRRPYFPSGKIEGGVVIPIEDVPYLVAIVYQGELVCGGSIITKRHILTANSCLTRYFASDLDVRTGSSSSQSGGTVIKIKSFKSHPKYNTSLLFVFDYDVAVIELEEDIQLNPRSAIITLADTEAVSGNALVAGWGYSTSKIVGVLHSVVVPLVNRTECGKPYLGKITARMICAGKDEKSFCDGDVGGPLVAGEKDVRTQVGIASKTIVCGLGKYPGVYTNVAHSEIRSFIREQAGV